MVSLGLGFWYGSGVAGGCHGSSPWYLNSIVVNKPWLKYLKRFETGKRLGVLVGGFCYSKSIELHDKVIGEYIQRHSF